jgi:hypothetical protein
MRRDKGFIGSVQPVKIISPSSEYLWHCWLKSLFVRYRKTQYQHQIRSVEFAPSFQRAPSVIDNVRQHIHTRIANVQFSTSEGDT